MKMQMTLRGLYLSALLTAAAAACSSAPSVEPATMVVRGGKIVTVDEDRPEAQALAIRGDRIVALGTSDEIAAYIGPATEVIELAGQTAIPGFIEGHGHFVRVGQARMILRLEDTQTWDEVVAIVAEAVKTAQPGDWIEGRGWHQEKWTSPPTPDVQGFPVHDTLTAVSPNNPVYLEHVSGHASFANARAMEIAGVTSRTPNPRGGDVMKDAAGRPIGVFRETADGLIGRAFDEWRAKKTPEDLMAEARRQIELAVDESLSHGVTTFQDAGASFATVDLYKQVVSEGKLGIRLWVMVRDTNANIRDKMAAARVVGMGNNHLTVAALKKTIDGALGSRTAWLLEPYSDMPSSTGINTLPVEEVAEAAELAAQFDVQMCVHAIGDRANREVLNMFEAVMKAHPDKMDLRFRIEHAQHVSATDIPRFAQLGVIASMQGVHCTSDAPYVPTRLGDARSEEGAYVWQKLMKSGAIVSNGTDTPVEAIDPIANFYSTVSRKSKDGNVFYGDQRMSRAEALKSLTWNAAYAAKEEALKGSLAPGKLADITVLSQDIMTVPEEEIVSTTIVHTIVGGKVMFSGSPKAN